MPQPRLKIYLNQGFKYVWTELEQRVKLGLHYALTKALIMLVSLQQSMFYIKLSSKNKRPKFNLTIFSELTLHCSLSSKSFFMYWVCDPSFCFLLLTPPITPFQHIFFSHAAACYCCLLSLDDVKNSKYTLATCLMGLCHFNIKNESNNAFIHVL